MDAITRIKQLGMPRRNNELWTFFPVNKIPNVLSADGDCRVADAPRNDSERAQAKKRPRFRSLFKLPTKCRQLETPKRELFRSSRFGAD